MFKKIGQQWGNEEESEKNRNWVIGEVYQTDEYHLFHPDSINRHIRTSHVNKLKKSLENHQVTDFIKVYEENGELIIWDGQHRFEALKSLGRSIAFVVIEKPPVGVLAEVNNAVHKWTLDDYIDSFAANANSDVQSNYKLFLDTKKRIEEDIVKNHNKSTNWSIKLSCFIPLLTFVKSTNHVNGNIFDPREINTHIREGIFTLNEDESKRTINLAMEVMNIYVAAYDDTNDINNKLIQAYILFRSLTNFDKKVFLRKISMNNKMSHYRDIENYLRSFQEVYNYNQKTQVVRYALDAKLRKTWRAGRGHAKKGPMPWNYGFTDLGL